MGIVTAQLARDHPDANARIAARVLPERLARPYADQARSNAFAAGVILTLAGLVAVLAAVNVATLLLVRAAGRSHEFAVRTALGAGWARLARQSVTEGLVLAMLGGIAGTLLGVWATRAVTAIPLPADLPVRFDFALDGRVLAYVTLLVLGTGFLVGLLPVMRAGARRLERPESSRTSKANTGPNEILAQTDSLDTRQHMLDGLRQGLVGDARAALHGIRVAAGGAISRRGRGALAVVQISLCFVLLVATGLSVRSLAASVALRAE